MTFRHALRSLQRAPTFTIAVILSLVLGIASVGAMFAIVYGVLLAPLPFGEPDRLVSIGLLNGAPGERLKTEASSTAELHAPELRRINMAPGLYFTYERLARSLEGVALYRTGSMNVRMSDGEGAAESIIGTWVSASMIPLLQIPPLLGRTFSAEEELRGGPNAVILSEAEWRNRFAAASDVIGKMLIVNDAPREIVGVMPARFSFPTLATRLWLPAKYTNDATVGDFSYAGVARLAAGATVQHAQTELSAILPRMAELFPRLQAGGSTASWLAEVRPTPVVVLLRDELTGTIARTLWMLAAAAALVLFVAWANVANLMLVRSESRQLELAVRQTLGASRLRIASHFLDESVVLGATAGMLALLLAHGAVRILVVFGPADIPRLCELGVGWVTTSFIVLVTVLGIVVCAAVPALHARRSSLARNLGDGARGQSAGKARQRVRSGISVLQIALALVVTVGSALLLRTAQHLHAVQPGFDANAVTTFRTLLPYARYGDADNVAFYARLTERVGQLPSVRAAGLTMQVPLAPGAMLEQTFRIDADGRTLTLPVNVIGNGFFAAMHIPLLAGRDFRRLDSEQSTNIIISQRAAAALFGGPNAAVAVGKSLKLASNGPTYTIVGVVGDVRYQDLAIAPSAMIYRPQVVPLEASVELSPRASMALVVNSNGAAAAVLPAIRQIVRGLDATVPIFDVKSMQDVVQESIARQSLVLALLSAAAAITLVLGAIGLYGVMAYRVALQAREFGVRVALGADPRQIARLVITRGLVLTLCGVAAGFALYGVAAPFLRAFLYGVTVSDPWTITAATLVVIATSALASWLPARRAAQIEALEALRAE